MSSRRVTLTFDNGPSPGVTERVLDVLDEHDLSATFFVCGKNLADPHARELIFDARQRGHWIGNHTMTHSTSLGEQSDPDTLRYEIGAVQEMLGSAAHAERFFRPRGNGGVLDRRLLSRNALTYLADNRYSVVLWTSVPRDWEDPDGWPDRAMTDIGATEHTVLVVHDIPSGAMRQLPAFIERVRDDGAEFVQDFPDSCVPMRRGALLAEIDHLIAADG